MAEGEDEGLRERGSLVRGGEKGTKGSERDGFTRRKSGKGVGNGAGYVVV